MLQNRNNFPVKIENAVFPELIDKRELFKRYFGISGETRDAINSFIDDKVSFVKNCKKLSKRIGPDRYFSETTASIVSERVSNAFAKPGDYTVSISERFSLIGKNKVDENSCLTHNNTAKTNLRLNDCKIILLQKADKVVARCLARPVGKDGWMLFNFYPREMAATMTEATRNCCSQKENPAAKIVCHKPVGGRNNRPMTPVYHNAFADAFIFPSKNKYTEYLKRAKVRLD